jgi:hypothetical protein
MSKTARQFILFGAPLFVGVINWFHPVHFEPTGIYEGIHDVVNWWITLHVLNLFGFAMLGLAAYLLVGNQQGIAANVARIVLAIFVPTYAGFDSIIGIGTGSLVQYAKGLPLDKLTVLEPAIDAFWTNNVATMLAIIGSTSWGIGMSATAIAFAEPKRRPTLVVLGVLAGALTGWGYSAATFGTLPWWSLVGLVGLICLFIGRPSLPVSLLILSGVLFGTTHVLPYGPLGMLCFVAAAAMLEFAPNKAKIPRVMAATPS